STEMIGEGGSVFDDLLLVLFESGLQCLVEADRLGRDDMHERAALNAGENHGVDLFRKILVIGENETAAGTAQALVGCRRDKVGVLERRRMNPGGDESGNVGHVD